MSATMKDIAAKTGLGLATISKYLNGGHVLEKNRIAIEQAIKELDFQVNEFARSLKTRQSKTVGIVIPQLNNLFMTSIVSKVEETLRHHGYGVLVCDTAKQEQREEEVLQFLLNKMVDGIILMASSKDAFGIEPILRRKIPVVLIDRKIERMDGILDMVLLDNEKAGYESTEYLIKKGHRQIGILIGPNEVYTSNGRLSGYHAAMKAYGLEVNPLWVRTTDFSMEDSYQQTIGLLQICPQITAIFATNFEMTLGALLALKDSGLSVPGQVSLLGFDNRELARAMQPCLTIVSQPFEEMGITAAEILLERMQQPQKQQKEKQPFLPEADEEAIPEEADEKAKTIILEAVIEEGASVQSLIGAAE